MRIVAGCGEFPAPGWLNVDLTHPSADVHHDITTGLPALGEPISRIYAGHVLEHLPYEALPGILSRWRDDADIHAQTRLAVVGPDCDRAELLRATGAIDDEQLRLIVEGGHRWDGDVHLWRSTPEATTDALLAGGWRVHPARLADLSDDGWPLTSLIDWQFALLASPA